MTMTSRDGTLTRLVYSIIPTLKKVIMLSNSCNFDSYHSFLPVELVESGHVIAPFNFAQFSSDTCATDSLSHNNSPANHNLVAEHIFNDNCFIIGNYQTKDVNQNNTNRTFPSKIKSSKESLHEVRNMFPDPSNRYCVICKRANMSFKKNYFIHAQNAELYQKTFPSTSIMFGPVCSTDFNKVWRYSRGEYIPSADGSGRTIKNLKPSQKRTFSDSTLKRKKIKQSTEIVPYDGSCSILLKFHSTTNNFDPIITLLRLDYNIFPSEYCSQNGSCCWAASAKAMNCYSITFKRVEVESIFLISDNHLCPVDEPFLKNLIHYKLLKEGDTFHVGLSCV